MAPERGHYGAEHMEDLGWDVATTADVAALDDDALADLMNLCAEEPADDSGACLPCWAYLVSIKREEAADQTEQVVQQAQREAVERKVAPDREANPLLRTAQTAVLATGLSLTDFEAGLIAFSVVDGLRGFFAPEHQHHFEHFGES